MAIAPPLTAYSGRNDELQPQLEAEVRRLLRRAGNPFLLAANPLAQALCEATGIPSPQTALRRVIDGAFQDGFQEARLRAMLLAALEKGDPGIEIREPFPISKRHFHRRRAKAVAILAARIREIIGGPALALVEERSVAGDPLDAIAELVSHVEPSVASHIFRLGGPRSAANASMLALRERVDAGADFEEATFERSLPAALVAILRAQSHEIAGKDCAGAGKLWPHLARAAHESSDAAEIRFELEWLGFLRARHSGDVRQAERIARNLQRLAHDRASWVVRALLAHSEAKIRCGRLDEATALLDAADRRGLRSFAVTELAFASALRGELALERGEDAAAERFASGAYLVLCGRHFSAYRCQASIARARLRLDERWVCPADIGTLPNTAWDRVALDVERARRFFADGDAERSSHLAMTAFETATLRSYGGLAARAAATVGASFEGSSAQRRAWYLRALAYLLATRDRSIGCDLFVLEEGGLYPKHFASSDGELIDVLYSGLARSVPQLYVRTQREVQAVRIFLEGLMAAGLGSNRTSVDLEAAICRLETDAQMFAQYFVHFLDDAAEILHTFLTALVDTSERARVEYRLGIALRGLDAIEPRNDLRQFLVG